MVVILLLLLLLLLIDCRSSAFTNCLCNNSSSPPVWCDNVKSRTMSCSAMPPLTLPINFQVWSCDQKYMRENQVDERYKELSSHIKHYATGKGGVTHTCVGSLVSIILQHIWVVPRTTERFNSIDIHWRNFRGDNG